MPRKSTTTLQPAEACSSKTHQLNIRIPTEAFELLREYAPTRKSYGELISRFLFEERARREERQRLTTLYGKNGTQN
jgi:hypothetical protein